MAQMGQPTRAKALCATTALVPGGPSRCLADHSSSSPVEQPRSLVFSWQQPPRRDARAALPLLASITQSPVGSTGQAADDRQNAAAACSTSGQQQQEQHPQRARFPPWKQLGQPPSFGAKNRHRIADVHKDDEASCLALESDSSRRLRVYNPRGGLEPVSQKSAPWEGFDIVQDRQSHEDRARAVIRAYLLPNGFPESVAPQYAHYMGWRGVQYFFGGAISVFTTQSLLGALGVAGKFSGEAAAAINWVIKDGAGRLGRLLFARWGRELDCELKQFRLAGDLLMEVGAALELSTVFAPRAFLPLACTANLAKNLAAVAASSTRAPIYRTFALQNNLADITAKGESVANLADILGTVAGILLSKAKLPMVPTFCCLSVGYLIASRKEVDSVELPYMNRARLSYSTRHYLLTGHVPEVGEANHSEPLLPWGTYHQHRLVLGASIESACAGPSDLAYGCGLFRDGKYIMTYRPETKKVYVLLRQGATPMDCLKASFTGHVFLHIMDGRALEALAPLATPKGQQAAAAALAAAAAATALAAAAHGKGHQAAAAAAAAPAGHGQHTSSSSRNSSSSSGRSIPGSTSGRGSACGGSGSALQAGMQAAEASWGTMMTKSKALVDLLYPDFIAQAEQRGWKLQQTMLNPKETRILKVQPLAL